MTANRPRRVRRPKMDGKVMSRIEELVNGKAWGGTQVYRQLEEDGFKPPVLPTLRAVQAYVAKIAPQDKGPSNPWTLVDEEPEDPRPVLAAVAAAIELTEGRVQNVSRLEAHLISRLVLLMPELEPGEAWRLARLYAGRLDRKEPTADLDALFAFWPQHPDRSSPEALERQRRYGNAVARGWIPGAPSWTAMGTARSRELLGYMELGRQALAREEVGSTDADA